MLLDDSYVAKMIFDESNHQISPLVLNQKSPMHKSVASLQDVTEIRRPMLISSNVPSSHKHLSGTQSLAYPPQSYDSNRSFDAGNPHHGSNEFHHDNILREHNKFPPQSSSSMPSINPVGSHTPGGGANMYQEQYRIPFIPSMSNSPNSTPYHRSSHDSTFQTHATITVPSHPMGHRNSSPDNLYSPGLRSSFNSSRGGNFSPEPSSGYGFQNQLNSPRSRPHSTHSRGTPPPPMGGVDQFQNPRNSRGIGYKEKEMDLAEALMMDQDEGTLV